VLSNLVPFRRSHYSGGSVISITFEYQLIRGWQLQALISTAQLKGGKMKALIASLAATVVLCACGGGDGDPQLQEGLYLGGSIDFFDFSEKAGSVLVLENQEVWALLQTTGLFQRAPAKFGKGSFRFTGPDLAFTDGRALVAIASTTLGESTMTLTRSTILSNVSTLVVGLPLAPTGAEFLAGLASADIHDYNRPARISDVAGAWRPGLIDSSFTVDQTGAFAATTPAGFCPFTGSLTPRPSGKNVFNVTLTVTDCADAGTYTGVAVSYLDRDSRVGGGPFATATLRLMAIDQGHTKVFARQVQR
jgi:hypothetical protein